MDFPIKPLITLLAIVNPIGVIPFFIHFTRNFTAAQRKKTVSIAVVPLTIPLLTGPASISTVVIYAEKTKHFLQLGVLVGYGLFIGIATWLALSAAGRIGRFMGQTGINVMTRLMGLILAAIAVEVMSDGLIKLFPALAG